MNDEDKPKCDQCGESKSKLQIVDENETIHRQFCEDCCEKLVDDISEVVKKIEDSI